MVNLNFDNLPEQEGFKIDIKEVSGYEAHPESAPEDDDDDEPDLITRPFGSEDFHLTYLEGDPGSSLPWHTHTPSVYLIYFPIGGRIAVSYKDNDGNEHRTEAGPFEVVYLPPGAHNKLELVGEERCQLFVVMTESPMDRLEQLVGEPDESYDPQSDPTYGLQVDTLHSEVKELDEDAVERY